MLLAQKRDGFITFRFPGGGPLSEPTRIKVAIADDDEAVRASLAALIETYGFDVRTFASGADLLNGHAAEPAHCLMLDHHMPVATGLDVLQTLRQRGDTTPVILITGLPNRALDATAKSLGATSILYKPMSQAELMVAVERAVASRER